MPKKHEYLSEQVEDKLFSLIIEQEKFQPGDRLPNEQQLSEMFGVSRTTLREAIRALAAQGILETRRGSGTYISDNIEVYKNDYGFNNLSRIRIRQQDVFELRSIIEPEAARLACRRASKEEMADIIKKGEYVAELIAQKKEWIRADQEFHSSILRASHNEFLICLAPIIKNAVFEFTQDGDHQLLAEISVADNKLILEFLELRDEMGAKYAMAIHITHTARPARLYDPDR